MNEKTLYTGGTFDLFHFGHVNFLKQCYKICSNVVVGLNTDNFVSEYKSPSIMTYEEREKSLKQCQYVSNVVPNTFGKDSKPTILSVRPDIIAVGSDWCNKDYYKQMDFTADWLNDNNIALIYVPYTLGISTSEIRRRLLND
tara:strand:- start:1514 stop:1939 length:426 start_codon:yes stop_codon:yes gene_type:complete